MNDLKPAAATKFVFRCTTQKWVSMVGNEATGTSAIISVVLWFQTYLSCGSGALWFQFHGHRLFLGIGLWGIGVLLNHIYERKYFLTPVAT
jgi:hypothetical protein